MSGPRLPAPSRAFWKNTIHCKLCKRPRPAFLQSRSKQVCIPCFRARATLAQQKSRSNEGSERRKRRLHAANERRKSYPKYLQRARNAYSREWKENWKAVRGKVEDFFPIYKRAEELAGNDPEYNYIIVHKVPMRQRNDVCGIHTPCNLTILKTKKPPNVAARSYYRKETD